MEQQGPPGVVRERISRLREGCLSCTIVFEREFSIEEIARFRAVVPEQEPAPSRFLFEGRTAGYDCPEGEEALWRLALEIYLVKSFRPPGRRRASTTEDVRLRRLHLG